MTTIESPLRSEKSEGQDFRTEQLRRFGDAYVARHSDALDLFCESEDPTLDKLCDIFWQSGVIDRLAPADHEEAVARRVLGKDVFDGDSEDAELFWRLLYVCAQIESVKDSGLGERSSWLARPIEFTIQKLLNTNPGLYNELFTENGSMRNPDPVFIEAARERAIQALEKLGENPHLQPLTIGASVRYAGISAKVHGYTEDGLVVLHAADRQDHMQLVRANPRKGCAVLANEIGG